MISKETEIDMGAENDSAEEEADLGLQSAVGAEIEDAIDYIDTVVSPDRAKAIEYYRGELFGNEDEGRSTYVSTDVRDTVLGMLPPLMRIFAGAERIAEFVPAQAEDIPGAEQATDVIHYVFQKQNPGFSILYSTFKDALVSKTGIVKWWHEEQVDTNEYEYSGLTDGEVALLAADPELTIVEMEMEASAKADMMSGGELVPMGPPVYEVTVRRIKKQQKYCVAGVPPEEFLIDRKARDLDSASLVAHRQIKTVSDLVAMGYDEEMLLANSSAGDDDLETNEERFVRNPYEDYQISTRNDPASRKVLYIEAYIRYDRNGDGIAELLKVCTVGSAYKVVNVEGCDEIPFALFTPDPEPHTVIGLSEADKVMDIQATKSEIMRDMLDSLAQSIHPRTAVVEGQVNIDDVLNNETGAIIRMRAPGMVQPFSQPFVGQAAFPMLQYMDETKETRTGVSKASQGLNADALQSSTRAAVAATISAAQGRVELVARIFAETGLKRLFRGLLRLIVKNQNKPMIVRLRNQFVPIDPRVWNSDMDVDINVALSATSTDERREVLASIAQKQEMIMQSMGPNNPLVTMAQYRNTLAKLIEMAGFKDASAFFNEVPPDWQPQPEQATPTPEQILAQVQAESIQADIQKKAAELQLDREKMLRSDDRERDRIEADVYLRAKEMELKYGTQVDIAAVQAMMARDREAMQQMQTTQGMQ